MGSNPSIMDHSRPTNPDSDHEHGGDPPSSGAPRNQDRLAARTLVLSPVLPPNDSGHAVILHRFFRSVAPDDYRLVTFGIHGITATQLKQDMIPLPAKTFNLVDTGGGSSFTTLPSEPRMVRRLSATIIRRAALLARVIRREQCRVIIATSGDLPDIPAAILAGQITGTPVLLWYFDHWRYQTTTPFYRRITSQVEPTLTRAAAAVIVPNELLGNELARAHGITPVLIRNPTDASDYSPRRPGAWPSSPGRIRIVYTGQIYAPQLDAVNRLLDAIAAPDLRDVELHMYTAQTKQALRQAGLRGPFRVHPFVRPPDIYRVQQQADILLLALGFDTPYPGIIRTSATTKFADYLASGRPTLVHAPPACFPVWYARNHACGLIVDQPDSGILAAAIRTLRSNAGLRASLGENGIRQAASDFSLGAALTQLNALIARAVS